MEAATEALILKKIPYSGSSFIVSGYTRKFGIISFLVRGFGKKKGNRLAALEPMSMVDITFHYREKYDVQTVKEIKTKSNSAAFIYDPVKGSVKLFLAEMLHKSLREESSDEDLFDYIESSLEYFNSSSKHSCFHLIFLAKLTRFFGFLPKGKYSEENPYLDLHNGFFTANRNNSLHMLDRAESQSFSTLIEYDYVSFPGLGSTMIRKLLRALVEYYRLHLEGFGEVKSLDVLIEIFSE